MAEQSQAEVVVDVGGEPVYALQPRQLDALYATPLRGGRASHVGYGGAAGGGKSHLARAVATLVALEWAGSTGIIFRRTHPEIRENHIVPFLDEVSDHDGELYVFDKAKSVINWANGSRTLFGYLARDEHVKRYQGNAYDFMCFEEATHYSWYQVSWLTGNRLRASVDGTSPFALYPSNPGSQGHHWYKRLFITRNFRPDLHEKPGDYAFIPAKVTDNRVLLTRDPAYLDRLNKLPEPLRSQLREGDWEAGLGLALTIDRASTLIEPFAVPDHWVRFDAYDWGYNHPWYWGHFACDEDGNVYLVESATGRHMHEWEVIDRVKAIPEIHWQESAYRVAGHDCWHDYKARSGGGGETTAEQFAKERMPLSRANISRITGLNNLRRYLDSTITGQPRFRIFDTPTNRKVLECLESMPVDPDRIEDALKVDADDYGDGGDDAYDMVRYALMSRPLKAKEAPPEEFPAREYDLDYHDVVKRLQPRRGGRGF